MSAYRLWCPHNGGVHCAVVIEAQSPMEAALAYARSDQNGAREGLYYSSGRVISDLVREGRPIVVQGVADDTLEVFAVGVVELPSVFRAVVVDRGSPV